MNDFDYPYETVIQRQPERTSMTREERLRSLGKFHGLEIGGTDNSADEDFTNYFTGADDPQPIERWAAVTTAGDFVYIKADYDSSEGAIAAALENIDDNIYAETPMFVIDLDTGTKLRPRWSTLEWYTR